MKNITIVLSFLFLFSCGKKPVPAPVIAELSSSSAPYDTTAVDSFSAGATTVNIARQIRISSLKYQDSLQQSRKKSEAEKQLKAETAEKDKAAKKPGEEKKKAEALKINIDKTKPAEEVTAVNPVGKP
ncbi:hypothetical protein [Kaistella palustris]|uniref:hypothetical protein n=1 Tax=Kaistella palustris TaxID=493376 RepID=UPI0003F71717|nr:hypothetical protein [Kaistella palustris]